MGDRQRRPFGQPQLDGGGEDTQMVVGAWRQNGLRGHSHHAQHSCSLRYSVKEIEMQNRRDMLSHSAKVAAMLAAVGLWPGWVQAQGAAYNTAAFTAKTMPEVMKALGTGAPVESKDVTITGPDIAENGAVVPVGAASSLPGVKRLLLLVEKNPAMLAAMFDVTDAIEANISTRVKMGQSSDVYAVAMMNDGKVFFARKEIKVTLGGCGG
jgi:sulfur-oxidizing protein SoxY